MAAVDMIVAAGFAALDAGEADEAIEIPNPLGTSHKDFPTRYAIAHLRPGRSDHPE
jgi:hypothetical protein